MAAPELIARCLAVSTASHLSHLSTRSYADHMALQMFYKQLQEATDEFAEVYTGLDGPITSFPALKPPTGKPDTYIKELADWLVSYGPECADGNSALQSLIDAITAVCGQALYRLKFLE